MNEKLQYATMLEMKPTEENKTRLENVRELKSSIHTYVQNAEIPTLSGFLENNIKTQDNETISYSHHLRGVGHPYRTSDLADSSECNGTCKFQQAQSLS